jgi:hypothetical protein
MRLHFDNGSTRITDTTLLPEITYRTARRRHQLVRRQQEIEDVAVVEQLEMEG